MSGEIVTTFWIAFYDFINLIGVPYNKKDREVLDNWLILGRSTGWWCPFHNICFCFERPSVLNLDEEGRLHCEDGPAMAFRDGYSLFYYHGEEIPKTVIGNLDDADRLSLSTNIGTWQAFKNFVPV